MAEYSWPSRDATSVIGKDHDRLDGLEKAVVAVRALLNKKPNASEAEIREGLNGNICRCGTYANIINAAVSIAKGGN